jgi:hypothetical protein
MADPNRNYNRAQGILQTMYPNEEHNVGGDCPNPKCPYTFTPQDHLDIKRLGGWFDCPNCGSEYNLYDDAYNGYDSKPGGYTRAQGLTTGEMGLIGENIVAKLGSIEGVGQIIQRLGQGGGPHASVDFIIGPYGVEVKTNHSESQPRFKIGGERVMGANGKVSARQAKIEYCQQNNLIPAILGVRLNFRTDMAGIWFRPQMTDSWIGNEGLQHIADVNFAEFNPFRNPEDVPPDGYLPEDDEQGAPYDDIPF